jgi:hypothetical protein
MFTLKMQLANTLIAMDHLVALKWQPMHAAAIIGNLTVESALNPDTPRGDTNTAMGIAQWREPRISKFAEIIGQPIEGSTLQQQLDFVSWELLNTEKKAGTLLKATLTVTDATKIVDKYYERSSGKAIDTRIKYAVSALTRWADKKGICVSGLPPLA